MRWGTRPEGAGACQESCSKLGPEALNPEPLPPSPFLLGLPPEFLRVAPRVVAGGCGRQGSQLYTVLKRTVLPEELGMRGRPGPTPRLITSPAPPPC